MIYINKILYFFIAFIFFSVSAYGEIKDSLFATIGDKAITNSDIVNEIKVILINHGQKYFKVEQGIRIAQMVLCPITKAKIKEVNELEDTERGEGGFGSTGIK